MENAARQHKQVKHRMHVPVLFPHAIEYRTDGIRDAAQQQQHGAAGGEHLHRGADKEDDAPAHGQETDHGKDFVPVQVNGRQGDGHGGASPHDPENHPGVDRIPGAQRGQHDGGIGTGNQKIDGAVVDHLENLFGHFRAQAVVDAGHGVQQDHGGAVDGAADHPPDTAVDSGHDHAQHQRGNGERPSHDVGHHVEDLFAFGIVWQDTVPQFCSRHNATFFETK